MRILYYSAHPTLNLSSPSGYGTHMRETIRSFKGLGHEVQTFIVGGEHISPDTYVSGNGLLMKFLKKIIPSIIWESIKDFQLVRNDRSNQIKLIELIKEYQPDIIYERGYYLLLSGVNAAKKSDCFHVLEMNAPYPEERTKMSGKSWFYKDALKAEHLQTSLTNKLVVVSGALKEYYSKGNLEILSKTLIVHNAISESFIQSISEIERDQLKKELTLENKLVIGFVGSIFPYHGVEMLVSAFKKDYANSEGVGLLIVGAGVGLNDLMKNNTEYKNIIFTGNINSDNIPSHINLMDICVMAGSNWYGSPVKIFEYGAYKKPVIVPRVSPVLEIIDSEIDGIFVDSEGELITAMKRLIEDKTKRVLMGEALHRKIIEKHTWKKNAIRILSDLI